MTKEETSYFSYIAQNKTTLFRILFTLHCAVNFLVNQHFLYFILTLKNFFKKTSIVVLRVSFTNICQV